MIYKLNLLLLGLFIGIGLNNFALGQEKEKLTLQDIFKERNFVPKSIEGINWMNDGRFYTSLVAEGTADFILKYDIKTGEVKDTVLNGLDLPEVNGNPVKIDEYSFSADESQLLLATQKENIYRRSFKALYYIYDLKSKTLKGLADGAKQSYATFSPDGTKIAFVRNNNLYYMDLNSMEEYAITTDGKWNYIINGSTDWVYEEEFGFAQAFFWSPDSKKLAYYIFDESAVKEYNMQIWYGLYPIDYRFKYPKAGETNSIVDIAVYNLSSKQKVKMDLGEEKDLYIPRVYWTKDASLLSIVRLNRLQNKLEIIHGDVKTGETNIILTEESDTYVDINYTDDLTYLNDNKHFIRTSEKDGYKHIYLHELDGDLVRQITKGSWEVSQFLGIDEKKNLLYYISTEISPLERHLYSIAINGKNKKKLSKEAGTHAVNFSPDFKYYINSHSSITTPLNVSLFTAPKGTLVKVLEDNVELESQIDRFSLGTKEFISFENSAGVKLNAYIIKPPDFDPSKEYPLLMYVYGGPGSQLVLNDWGGSRESWFQYLAQEGYIVACVDNTGTGGRGKAFKHATYAQLGKLEARDQIEGAKFFGSLPYIDESRIGIWGWSYGGYMSSLSLFLGNDVFKSAIAVAPVTNWRFYDTIYTERYLKTPGLNPEGYDEYSPLSHIEKLKGNFLLIHGTGDDNVHFQNTVELVNGLIAANKSFETFYYPNRNHSIYGGNTSIHLYNMMSQFLFENL